MTRLPQVRVLHGIAAAGDARALLQSFTRPQNVGAWLDPVDTRSCGHTKLCNRAPLCSQRKGGTQNQALGRSRGGFSIKIHLRVNREGLPIGIVLTPGEAHDSTAYPDLTAERDSDPDVLLGDRGHDSDPIRDDVRARGGRPEIPTKRNRLIQHSVDHAVYTMRNRIERFINRLKNSRRIATRYDHTSISFLD
jgi:transposase